MEFPKHVVAVCALVTNGEGEVLLVRNPERGWEVPGGQVEEGEELMAALEREVMEETGASIAVGALVGVYANLRARLVILGFLGTYSGGVLTPSAESPEVGWFPRDRALEMVSHPAIRARVGDMLGFAGRVVYRAYTVDPYRVVSERLI